MNVALKESSRKKQKLYKKTLHCNSNDIDLKAYQEYRNIYNRLKTQDLLDYYKTKMLNFKNNTKELWRLINKSIGKTKNTGSIIPFITVKGIKINNPDKIADKFGQFYSTLGSNLASQIKKGTEQNQ